MELLAGELAEIVWAETKALGVARADGTGEVNGARRLVAQLAASTGGAGFDKREALPSVTDRMNGDAVRALLSIVEVARDAVAPQSRLIIWEAGVDTVRPNSATKPPPPAPWDTMTPAGITHQGRFQLVGGRLVDVFSRAPLDAPNDGAVFVNALTGTGAPDGKVVLAPRSTALHAKPGVGFWLLILATILFVVAGLCAYGAGAASRLAMDEFQKTASLSFKAPVPPQNPPVPPNPPNGLANCNPINPAATVLDIVPETWRPRTPPAQDCQKLYAVAQAKVIGDLETRSSLADYVVKLSIWTTDAVGGTLSLVWPLIIAFVSLTVLFVSAGYGIVGRPMGAIIDDRNRMSLTLAQVVLWTVTIFSGWLVLGLYNSGFAAQTYATLEQLAAATAPAKGATATDGHKTIVNLINSFIIFPAIPGYLMATLGLSVGSPIVSRLIANTNLVAPAPDATAPNSTHPQESDYLDQNADPSEAKLTDMVVQEVKGAQDLVDTSRVQHVATTGILVISYAMLLFDSVAAVTPIRIASAAAEVNSVFTSLPPIDGTFVSLLLVSHAVLLGGKVFQKKTEPASQ